jgi:hypothetical protein
MEYEFLIIPDGNCNNILPTLSTRPLRPYQSCLTLQSLPISWKANCEIARHILIFVRARQLAVPFFLFIYIYILSGSALSSNSIVFSYIVNTIPPLSISRPNLGRAPDQNVLIPSSLNIRDAHTKLFLYSFLASSDCMRVLTVSMGMVVYLIPPGQLNLYAGDACATYTVIVPATAPSPNVLSAPSFSPGATYPCANCFKLV